jgi:hypothetical protein
MSRLHPLPGLPHVYRGPPRPPGQNDLLDAVKQEGPDATHEGFRVLESALVNRLPLKTLELLVEKGASTAGPFRTPLLIWALRGYGEDTIRPVLRFLVRRAGQDPNQTHPRGGPNTPAIPVLGHALFWGNFAAAKELILLGADIDDPRLDQEAAKTLDSEAAEVLVKARNLRKGSNVARSRIAEGAIAEYAESQGLSPAVGPGVGVTFEEELVGKPKVQGPANRPQGGRKTQKSATRHRKTRHRKTRRRH